MRRSGILMHISSLPNAYGIGTMGKEAYDFVDFLVRSGQSIWQILPLSQTSYGDSPYQSFSIYAGNPYFISLEELEKERLLEHAEYAEVKWSESPRYVDYSTMYDNFYAVMRKAYARFSKAKGADYAKFLEENPWLGDYSLFMALKDAHGGKAWGEWEEPIRRREPKAVADAEAKYAEDMDFYCFLQFKFFEQWEQLKTYANDNGIEIVGDIPIYCALDSADVWCEPELFQLDKDLNPIVVAGFPPDGFSKDGQLWGNPIYDWDKMKEENFRWWIGRMSFAKKLYDIVRIDHFIGFNSYYAIPFGDTTARNGKWCEGPKYPLFEVIKEKTGEGGIIAEDLGIITPAVRLLLNQCGYPGMKVLEFAFDPTGESEFLPQNFTSTNCLAYTATHDNDTVAGWVSTADEDSLDFCREYLGVEDDRDIPRAFVKLGWTSIADIAMTTIQELCGYGTEARINVPSTLGGNNWRWRASEEDLSDDNAEWLLKLTKLSNRFARGKKTEKSEKSEK